MHSSWLECLCHFSCELQGKDRKGGNTGNQLLGFTILSFRSNDGFWVGKSSLRSWRQLALEQLDEQDGEAEQSNGKMNGSPFNKGEGGAHLQS